MSETIEVPKKEYLGFQISKLELKINDIDANIEKLKQKKLAIKNEIQKIKENNRDVFPARGRKKKVD